MKTIVIVETYIRASGVHCGTIPRTYEAERGDQKTFHKNDFGDPLKLIAVNSKSSGKVLGISL